METKNVPQSYVVRLGGFRCSVRKDEGGDVIEGAFIRRKFKTFKEIFKRSDNATNRYDAMIGIMKESRRRKPEIKFISDGETVFPIDTMEDV